MISIISIITICVLKFVVTVTFLQSGYDIYHRSMPQASSGFRDYPTTITVQNYTHDFGSAILCEATDGTDLSPEETLREVTQCFSNYAKIRDSGFTPTCTSHELAAIDWHYDLWFDFIVAGMVLYAFFLIIISAHDIAVLCKRSAIVKGKYFLKCIKVEGKEECCHCTKFRQWMQLLLMVVTIMLVVLIGCGCYAFTGMSAIASSFISRFDLGSAGGILPCNCGCVLQTPTAQGWAFWFTMHLFMWIILLVLNQIKQNYKVGPKMLTMKTTIPIEMGEYGIDDSVFWDKVQTINPGQDAILVDIGNSDDRISCSVPLVGRFLRFKDWTLTVFSYRMFYTLLVLVAGVVCQDVLLFGFQILVRSYPETRGYIYSRVLAQMSFSIVSGVVLSFTFAMLQLIESSPSNFFEERSNQHDRPKNFTSTLFSGLLLNAGFHLFSYATMDLIHGYFNSTHFLAILWYIIYTLIAVSLFSLMMVCLCCWDRFERRVDLTFVTLKTYVSKMFERDSMGQNLQFFICCGGPLCCYPNWFVEMIDFKVADLEFQVVRPRRNAGRSVELGGTAA